MKAEFGRLLRPCRRPARPVGGRAARARQTRGLVLAIALLAVATFQVDAGSAAPSAAPDPPPAAQGSAAQPSPDPYEAEVPPVREPEQRTTTRPPSVTYDSTSTPTQERIATPARGTEPRQKTQKPNTTTKPSTGQRVVNEPAPRRSRPAVAAASLDGRPLLFGALGMIALTLASGSLLFLVSRTGGWETRS